MYRKIWFLPILTLTLSPAPVPSQDEVAAAEYRSSHVSGNVHVVQIRTANSQMNMVLSAGPDGALLVDHREAEFGDRIAAEIRKISSTPVQFLINTHWHLDHVGGNARYGSEATIITTANARRKLTTRTKVWWNPEPFEPLPRSGWPKVTFEQSLSLHFNGEEIQLWHFGPAHTDTDLVVFFTESNVVHMGDLFHGRGKYSFGQDVEGLTRTLEQVLQRIPPDAKIITGHGVDSHAIASRDDLAAYIEIQRDATTWMRGQIEEGKTLEQVLTQPLPKKWTGWHFAGGQTPQQWIENIYRSLKGELRPS